jgi:Peptidase family M23
MLLRALLTLVALFATAAPAQAAWVWPADGEVITPYRNGDDPYAAGQHRGIDIAASVGAPVVAAAGGEVRFAGTAGFSGLTVSIRTADGAYDTSYLHLSEATVRKGERVAAGDRLGSVGTTGVRSAERPHLHFGVRDAGTEHAYHDPLAFLPHQPAAPERPVPAPAPAPLPLTPEPAPQAAPQPRAAPQRAPRALPHRAPRAVPRRAPHLAPRGAPGLAPRAAPHGAPGLAPRAAPHGAPGLAPRAAPRGAPAPHASRPLPATRGGPLPKPVVRDPHGAAPQPAAGPDLGLVLACLGLLAAAAVLGLSGGDRREGGRRPGGRPARHRLTALVNLRPGRG